MPFIQVRDHTFFPRCLSSQSIIFDLGANHGEFSHEVIRRFGCRVYAVEANPDLCRVIAPLPNLTVMNVAMAGQTGTLPFYLSDRSDEASSILVGHEGPAARKIEVPAITLPELVKQLGVSKIDLLKVDIEGAEIEMFEATPDSLLVQCTQITVEFHDFCGFITQAAAKRVVDRMRRLGFDAVVMWMRSHGDTLFVNRRLARVSTPELLWNRYAVRNWWWLRRKVRTKLGWQAP
jgi:FkbM family methyltransferase